MTRRMDHALNGPTRPNLPKASPFMVEDAEAEIRRNVQRHYEQLADIEKLKTDVAHWQQRALLAEAEIERLAARLKQSDEHVDELKGVIVTLQAQFETGAQIWLSSYNTLKTATHLKVVTPAALIEAANEPEQS